MKTVSKLFFFGMVVAVVLVASSCMSGPTHPALSPVSSRWSEAAEGMDAPVVYRLPGMDTVKTAYVEYVSGRSMDVYYPGGFDFSTPASVVVFVMGYSTDFTMNWFGAKLKDLGQYISWGQLVAASGLIGVAYETDYPDDDIDAVLRYIVGHGPALGMDQKKIALFTCSGNTLTALEALTDRHAPYTDSLQAGVIYYPVISYFMNTGDQVMPAPFKRQLRTDLPIFLVTVGNDRPEWKEAVENFTAKVDGEGYPLQISYYENGVHGFDTDQDSEESRALISHTISFLKEHLLQ